MNSKEFSSNKKNKFAKQTTQNLKICEKNSTFYDSVTENLNLKSCQNLSFLERDHLVELDDLNMKNTNNSAIIEGF